MDGSGSMRGFLAPGANQKEPELYKLARMRQTVISLHDALSPQGVTQSISRFMVFEGNNIAEVKSDDQWRALTGSDCLITEPDENGNTKTKKHEKLVKPICRLESKFEIRTAYTGQSLSHDAIIADFLNRRDDPDNNDKPDLAVVISDLYSYNKTAAGDASEILDPLHKAMNKGLSIALFSVWAGFDGRIVDLPPWVKQTLGGVSGSAYKGRLPLHLLMVGDAAVLRSVVTRLQDRLTSGTNALVQQDINILLFDAKAKPQGVVGKLELAGAKKGEIGFEITPPDRRKEATYLGVSHNREADKPETDKAAKGKSEERGLRIGWNARLGEWWPGEITYRITRNAWALAGGGCTDMGSWRLLPDTDKSLGIVELDKGKEHVGLEIFKGRIPENTYAIELTLNAVDGGKLRDLGDWALVEQDAPGALSKALTSNEPIAARSLGTLNLDRLVDGLWYKTRDVARGQGDGGTFQLQTDIIVIKKTN